MDLSLGVGPGYGPGSGRGPGSGLKTYAFPVDFIVFYQSVEQRPMFFALFTQKSSFGLEFASQVVTSRGVFEGGFSKNTVFSAGGGHGRDSREGNSTRHIEFSYQVRTLNARRMFGEKCVKLTEEI